MVTWYKFTLAVCRKQDLNLSIMIDIPSEKKSLLITCLDDPNIRVSRSLNETQPLKRQGPAGPGAEKYIETLVVVDPKMANFHGEDASKQYALSACNIVS